MRTSIWTSILILTLLSCKSKTDKQIETADCKPYFEYDNVEYYSIEIDDDSALNLGKDKPLTDEESKLQDLLIWGHSDKLSDSSKLQNIQTLGFKREEIPSDKFVQLDNIFCERKHDNPLFSPCISIYRDILIFRKGRKTIGFAKLCFSCGQSKIVGTDLNTEEFGQSGDMKKLITILDN